MRKLAVEVTGRERLRSQKQSLARPGEQELAAVLAGARAEIEHVIGGGDRVRIVLDHQDGVAQVAQVS